MDNWDIIEYNSLTSGSFNMLLFPYNTHFLNMN